MQEFSSDDFARMQEQAIERVRQMQKRSTNSADQERNKVKQAEATKKAEEFTQTPTLDEDDVKIYQKLSKPQQSRNVSKQNLSKQEIKPNVSGDTIKISLPKSTSKQNPLSTFLSMDNDTALILPLVLLLGKEGADDILLLALLYILT